jgi:hypothetical protein
MEHPSALAPTAAGAERSLRARITSESLALKVCVGVLSEVILGHLGVVAAVGGLVVSLTVEDVVEDVLRRRRIDKRTLWIVALVAWLLDHADSALAATGLRRRRLREAAPRAVAAPAVTVAVAAALVVGAFTAADAVAGKSVVGGHRHYTFFGRARSRVVFRLPATVSVQSPHAIRVAYLASARDTGGRAVAVSCSPASGSIFALGRTTVTCSAGGTTREFAVVVIRVAGPALTLPSHVLRIEAVDERGAPATFAAHSDGGALVVCRPAAGSLFPVGRTTVRCTARRGGAVTRGSFAVLVRDTTPPRIETRDVVESSTTGQSVAVLYDVRARDTVDGPIDARCVPASGAAFRVGTTTVTCSAADVHGNTSTHSFVVRVAHTSLPVPTLQLPAPPTVEATGADGATVTYEAAATDTVDGVIAASCSPASGTTFPIGSTIVHCTATNSHGKTASAPFAVTVVDTTAPTLKVPTAPRIEATTTAGAVADFTATATDAVTTPVAAACTPPPGGTFAIGTTAVTCTATDAAGNTASRSFDVVVFDAPPTFAPATAITAAARDARGRLVKYAAPVATDRIDGPLHSTCSPPPGLFPLGDTTVTCTATDSSGGTASVQFVVTVRDVTPPTVTVPSTVQSVAAGVPIDYGKFVSASDNVDGAVTPACTPPSGTTFAAGRTTVACTATDKAGNQSKPVTFTVSASFPVQ